MAKQDKTRQLSIEQENAIELLIQGKSDRETGETVGVSRQTVTEWRNRNADFIAELNKRRADLWGAQVERLRGLVSIAVTILQDDLLSEDVEVKRKAAIHILKAVGLYGGNLTPEESINPDTIALDLHFM